MTKYPVVLVHGLGFRDRKHLNYWGRIPKALESKGVRVYYCGQDAWGTIEENAEVVKQSIQLALEETGSEKVNVIAHSKGGLEARFAICKLLADDCVASLTTVSTPHYGSKTMDFLCRLPSFLLGATAFFVNLFFRISGDKTPDFYGVCYQLQTSRMKQFNDDNPDVQSVRYFSYASAMKSFSSDIFLWFPYIVVKHFDGENDGVVGVESARWGEFSGVIRGEKRRGVSHCDIVDMRRSNRGLPDICGVYVGIANNLTELGF